MGGSAAAGLKIPIEYVKGSYAQGNVPIWNGKKFIPTAYESYHQLFREFNSSASAGVYYSLGVVNQGEGSAQIINIMARADAASTTIEFYRRVFGSSTYTKIIPSNAFSYMTVASAGSTQTTDCPLSVYSGDEIIVKIISKTFSNFLIVGVNVRLYK